MLKSWWSLKDAENKAVMQSSLDNMSIGNGRYLGAICLYAVHERTTRFGPYISQKQLILYYYTNKIPPQRIHRQRASHPQRLPKNGGIVTENSPCIRAASLGLWN